MQAQSPTLEPLHSTEADLRLGGAPEKPRLTQTWALFIVLGLVVLGAALSLASYWPGLMIDDSRWQYQQVIDNAYEDWHPPVMAWIWRQLISITPGPAPMLVLQALLYWLGFALIASAIWKAQKPRLAIAICCAGFIPAPLALTGTIIKDTLMDGALLIASGLLLWRPLVGRAGVRGALAAGAGAALLLAAALRYNAFFACLPLALVALPKRLTCTWPRALLSSVVALAAFLAIGPAIASLLNAENTDVQLSLIIFDLGGITEQTKQSQFPPLHVQNPVAVNHRCYDPHEWDSYSDWAKTPCPLGFDAIQPLVDDEGLNARALWVKAIATHPFAYLEHRWTHFNLSTTFLTPNGPDFTAWSQSVANPWGFRIAHVGLSETLGSIANAASRTPLGWPIFWISLALAALTGGFVVKSPSEHIAIAASAFFYGAGYFLVGVATGMRYHMWTFTGAALAALLIGSEIWRCRSVLPRSGLLLMATIVLVPALMALASRIFLT